MRYRLVVLLVVGFFAWAQPAKAQIPANCLQPNGYADIQKCYPNCYTGQYIDLRKCLPNAFEYIPPQLLWHGYYDTFGEWVPFLPPYRLDTYNPSNYLTGAATRYDETLMDMAFQSTIAQYQAQYHLDAGQYLGGIALESCLIGYSAWVQIPGQAISAKPFLVSDCRALLHKYGAACNYGTVAEMVYEKFGLDDVTGPIPKVLIYLAPPGDTTFPPALDQAQPLNYASSWLDEADMTC